MSIERMKKQKEDTLRKILDVSWDIAIKEGLESLSIRKIAAALQYAPNNLYNYFKDKNELFLCLRKDSYEWFLKIMKTESTWTGNIRNDVSSFMQKLLQIALEEPQKYIVMTSDRILDDTDPMDNIITNELAEQLRKSIEKGEIKAVDPVLTAITIRSMAIGFIRMVSSLKNVDSKEIDKLLEIFNSLIFDGLK